MRAALGTVGVFVVAGPIIGLVLFATGMAAFGYWRSGAGDAAWVLPFLLIYGLPFAHFVGGLAAFVAGSIAAALSWWTGRIGLWIGGVAGLAGYMATSGRLDHDWSAIAHDAVAAPYDLVRRGVPVLLALVHVGAALGCWAIVRRRSGAHDAADRAPSGRDISR